jgi:hypothetical protein
MNTNRASLSDPYVVSPSETMRRAERLEAVEPETPRRTLMVAAGFVIALVSLAIGSLALVQVWMTSDAPGGTAVGAPLLQPWESLVMIVLGGLGFAAGAALVGIGMGRWSSPRPPVSEADYTGPGQVEDAPEPPRVV